MKHGFRLSSTNKRVKEIVSILVKYGIADWLDHADDNWVKKTLKQSTKKDLVKYSHEERIRLAITELGTTFIKLGQLLSTRTDIISNELVEELQKLQSSTPPDKPDIIHNRIKEEFGVKSIDKVFSDFEDSPIASASIAQVHRATLITGESVVVKVMHEGIVEKVTEDLKIMTKLAGIAQRYNGSLQAYQPLALIRQFSQTMLDELDFTIELNNLVRFGQNFQGDDSVLFPRAYKQQSGKTVLTMSFVDGVPISKIDQHEWSAEQHEVFANESADVFMEMIFRDRFYHADPHPGNLFARADGSLGVLDCGMVNRIDTGTHQIFEEIVIGIVEKNMEHIRDTVIDMCSIPDSVNYEDLNQEIEQVIDRYIDTPISQFDMSAAINDGVRIIQQYKLILPPKVSSVFRFLILLEGSFRLMYPEFNLAQLFKKYHSKILLRRYSLKNLTKRLIKNIHLWEQIAEEFPKTLNRLLQASSKKDFDLKLEHRNLEKSVNRLVMGLITASMFLGSSLLWAFKVPPQINGYSIVGIAGVIISGILAYSLIRNINRKNS